jgi:hypothetical protein
MRLRKHIKPIQCRLTHIRRDGGLLCRQDVEPKATAFFYKNVAAMSFSAAASEMDFIRGTKKYYCKKCLSQFEEILKNKIK